MICLGIESTAHTFGIGIIDDKGKILSNARKMFRPPKGGMKPVEVAEHHSSVCSEVLKQALSETNLTMKKIDVIAIVSGPGLPPCLKVGLIFAKALALKHKKPLIPVNHCIGHVEIAKLTTNAKDPLTVYVSGGNSQIIYEKGSKYFIIGETLDIAIGNALDKFARECGLEFPGGPLVEKLAKEGKYIELPYTVKGMDFSFSGICSEAVRRFNTGKFKLEDLCFSFQETAFSEIVEATERALAHLGKDEVMLTGGVAANQRLGEMLSIMCEERGARFLQVEKQYAGDNGNLASCQGIMLFKKYPKRQWNPKKIKINQMWRADEVDFADYKG